ncbi:CLCA_X family protein [Nitrincola alkalilacustris]|uniref:CLCA_X family protein n=1 Tax=Nitrincola alkalilacustris TaxID=1571224 RepID=UPI00124EF363
MKSHFRRGPDHRIGEIVDFVSLRKQFDFRSIEVGRWVSRAENEQAAEYFYDALCDLMTILGGTESLISLRGTLAIQYAIGGRPGVAAHYNPALRAFSLAKNAGPGSIAHEWFHALDHYLVDKVFMDAPTRLFASAAWLKDATPVAHPLNDALFECFRQIMLDEQGTEPSELCSASLNIDRTLNILYYSLPEELCARAFEAFVQDHTICNHFLVKGTKESKEAALGLYPRGAQRQRINEAFSTYFQLLGRALKRKEGGDA